MGLKSMRKASGLTQREAAELFGLKYRTYQNYENGVTNPDMDTAARFARYFGCTIGDLFELEEGKKATLTGDEQELVEIYRSLTPNARKALMVTAKSLKSTLSD
jgi:DNA-binding XRE family transcriptional regulator